MEVSLQARLQECRKARRPEYRAVTRNRFSEGRQVLQQYSNDSHPDR